MYIPKPFEITDLNEAISFMQQYSFATLVNTSNGVPHATHLPFTITRSGDQLVLSAHMARPNEQVAYLDNSTSLVIFTEPHAYIAPRHYEKELNVPTWNYIAVHAYGQATLVTEEDQQLAALHQMIASYDTDYLQQWATLPMDYKLKMMKGIVFFDIPVTDVQGKKKLSQNRTAADRESVTQALSQSNDANEQSIGHYMQSEMKGLGIMSG
jgi:transcriptional regulator